MTFSTQCKKTQFSSFKTLKANFIWSPVAIGHRSLRGRCPKTKEKRGKEGGGWREKKNNYTIAHRPLRSRCPKTVTIEYVDRERDQQVIWCSKYGAMIHAITK